MDKKLTEYRSEDEFRLKEKEKMVKSVKEISDCKEV